MLKMTSGRDSNRRFIDFVANDVTLAGRLSNVSFKVRYVPSNQCDKIGINFATLANCQKPQANF